MTPTPHHLAAAERWIAQNGTPTTDADMARMGREVAQEALDVVTRMGTLALEAIDAHTEDKKAGVETLAGMKGRDLMADIYAELRSRT